MREYLRIRGVFQTGGRIILVNMIGYYILCNVTEYHRIIKQMCAFIDINNIIPCFDMWFFGVDLEMLVLQVNQLVHQQMC